MSKNNMESEEIMEMDKANKELIKSLIEIIESIAGNGSNEM